jgi:hypothetical protein
LLSPLTKVILLNGKRHAQSLGSIHWPLGPITWFPEQTQPGTHLSGLRHWPAHVKVSHDVSHSLAQSLGIWPSGQVFPKKKKKPSFQ